jgi:hypothetical protein
MGKWDELKLKNSGKKILITKGAVLRREMYKKKK